MGDKVGYDVFLDDKEPGINQDLASEWREFVSLVEPRLERGAVEYGESTLRRSSVEILDEVEQEILDVMGWSFFAWRRIKRLRTRMKNVLREISQWEGR